MSEKKIQVPEGMLETAKMAVQDYNHFNPNDILPCLEEALRWVAENPIVPPIPEVHRIMSDYRSSHRGCCEGEIYEFVATEWQRRMFLAPEPEVPQLSQLDVCPFCACLSDDLSPVWDRETGKLTRLTCTHCKVAFYPAGDRDLAPTWNLRQKQHDVCEVCHPLREPEVPEVVKDLLIKSVSDK
jgi:hypothetical protein